MSATDKETLKIGKNAIDGIVNAVTFRDGDFDIMYIPSLNLSSYGHTHDEAIEMMKNEVLPDFCKSVLTKDRNFVVRELKKLGWIQDIFCKKDLCKKAHIDKEGILRDFDLAEDTVLEESSLELAC